jgi:hypothetical protein
MNAVTEQKSRHTSGEWVAGSVLVDGKVPEDEAVVYAGGDSDAGPETEIVIRGPNAIADAGLVAAAPDLLAALLEAETTLNGIDMSGYSMSETLRTVRAAIAKVEGR